MTSVCDTEIKSIELYYPLPFIARLDILPFICFYGTTVYILSQIPGITMEVVLQANIPLLFLHGFVLLLSQWNVDIKCWMMYIRVYDIRKASVVKISSTNATSPKQLCTLHVGKAQDSKKEDICRLPSIWFTYQKVQFCAYEMQCDVTFTRLGYPTKLALQTYKTSKGYTADQAIEKATISWGRNIFELPIPSFMALFKEHAVAPFFVFQIFSVLLWCLDEYVYYALLTLVMLVFLECTLVKQRQRNMAYLRRMLRPPQPCLIYRKGKWGVFNSAVILPGDLISMHSAAAENEDDAEVSVPCDVLLLSGSCVVNEAMLSGESVPLRKTSLEDKSGDAILHIDDGTSQVHKKHVLFSGTKILQQSSDKKSNKAIPNCPAGGCVGYALRTGFGTTQGNLMRTILFSADRASANNKEALLFILVLLVFAITSSSVVLQDGINDPNRSRFKLLLHCIMIVTSVVPPELPLQLSMAVNNSMIALQKIQVFCTEPFRIPFAGKVDVCCFDKTGTLTSDELVVEGIVGAPVEDEASHQDLVETSSLSEDSQIILAGCTSLLVMNGALSGDPLEKAVMQSISWKLNNQDCLLPPNTIESNYKNIRIAHRYPFSSDVKRMSTLVVLESNASKTKIIRVLSKGAPEVMKPLFLETPEYYDSLQVAYASKGYRVLAIGFRNLKGDLPGAKKKSRTEIERDLTFAGFLVLDCPLKLQSRKTIRDLIKSKHRVMMLTGDNPLTACEVAKKVGMTSKKMDDALILQPSASGNAEWMLIGGNNRDPQFIFNPMDIKKLSKSYTLCVTGYALTAIVGENSDEKLVVDHKQVARYMDVLEALCPYVTIFARTSPQQKEYIIRALNSTGCITSMCGDGTNDVGALKQAHVGISIINSPKLEQQLNEEEERAKKTNDPMKMMADAQNVVVKLGDASIASPFTSKSPSIKVAKDIIRQGRCTLVTTIQMYKILGVNCLITAYSLSYLYIHGVKQGDQQMTAVGIIVAMFFLFGSLSKPTKRLSDARPTSTVFCWPVMVSIMGQFAIHLCCLISVTFITMEYIDPNDPSLHPDGKFSPNILNTVTFLVTMAMQLNTFTVNHKGHPYMQSFRENKYLYRASIFAYSLVFIALFEIFTPINALLELSTFPSIELQSTVLGVLLVDTVGVYLLEFIVGKIFD